jgi:hypothetical protein
MSWPSWYVTDFQGGSSTATDADELLNQSLGNSHVNLCPDKSSDELL